MDGRKNLSGQAPTWPPRRFASTAQSVALPSAGSDAATRHGLPAASVGPVRIRVTTPQHRRMLGWLSSPDHGRLVPLLERSLLARRLDLLVSQRVEFDARLRDKLDARREVGHEMEEAAEVVPIDTGACTPAVRTRRWRAAGGACRARRRRGRSYTLRARWRASARRAWARRRVNGRVRGRVEGRA